MSISDQLAPGAVRLRPDDHFMILSETDTSPMHIGGLIVLDAEGTGTEGTGGAEFVARMRRQFAERLPLTPLLCRLVPSPEGYDSDVWADIALPPLEAIAEAVEPAGGWTDASLREWIAMRSMDRLDLSGPPFKAFLLPGLPGGRAALFLKVHHAVMDGIGFQTILRLLSDETAPFAGERREAALPAPAEWQALAEARFAALEPEARAHKARRTEALAELEALKANPETARPRTPVLKMSGPTSPQRAYATFSVRLDRIKALAKGLEGTVNDVFMAITGAAMRALLLELDDLPAEPLVVNSARSYRRPEHGDFGNRIVALHPHIGTHLADPLDRLHAIQASMANERRRTHLDEAMLGQPERPFGARDRRAKFAERMEGGRQLLPGNISLSNVPGPATPMRYGGYRQLANFPVPILGSGRFLNVTSRRNADMLDMGVMADPTRIPDVSRLPVLLERALAEYEALCP
ncbi:MAG: WS/DGAT domain-containing protein [Novosphingobium sp.]|nr:WS/DGAT domain-containing protein [Novosphingobium sp.]